MGHCSFWFILIAPNLSRCSLAKASTQMLWETGSIICLSAAEKVCCSHISDFQPALETRCAGTGCQYLCSNGEHIRSSMGTQQPPTTPSRCAAYEHAGTDTCCKVHRMSTPDLPVPIDLALPIDISSPCVVAVNPQMLLLGQANMKQLQHCQVCHYMYRHADGSCQLLNGGRK